MTTSATPSTTKKPRTDAEIQPCCGTRVWKAANGIESFGWSLRFNRPCATCAPAKTLKTEQQIQETAEARR